MKFRISNELWAKNVLLHASVRISYFIDCLDSCKCRSNGAYSRSGGKNVNAQGYCEYWCSFGGTCGDGIGYKKGQDCRGCKNRGKTSILSWSMVEEIK